MNSTFFVSALCFASIHPFAFAQGGQAPSRGVGAGSVEAVMADELTAFKARLLSVATRHLDLLAESPDTLKELKGKSAAGMTALAFYRMYETNGKQSYRAAALRLADGVLADMKATKFGVLFVKEKEKGSGEEIEGGGPPALGWYASALAYVYHREGKSAELKYVGGVLDRFPWNEEGWWASTIDIHTGEPKQPMTKPSPINKTAALAMAAGMTGMYLKDVDPELAARLRKKTEQCVYRQVIRAQEADGFWHYNLNGRDPKDKDVYGYFMLTANVLLELQENTSAYRDATLNAALKKAGEFAKSAIAPMTEPNQLAAPRQRATPGTPVRFTMAEDLKRAFQLGIVLIGTKNHAAGIKIVDTALSHFPFGNRGDDGAHAVYSTVLLEHLLREQGPGR